jgi:hypothetical protein
MRIISTTYVFWFVQGPFVKESVSCFYLWLIHIVKIHECRLPETNPSDSREDICPAQHEEQRPLGVGVSEVLELILLSPWIINWWFLDWAFEWVYILVPLWLSLASFVRTGWYLWERSIQYFGVKEGVVIVGEGEFDVFCLWYFLLGGWLGNGVHGWRDTHLKKAHLFLGWCDGLGDAFGFGARHSVALEAKGHLSGFGGGRLDHSFRSFESWMSGLRSLGSLGWWGGRATDGRFGNGAHIWL